jgi:hypothetical protein
MKYILCLPVCGHLDLPCVKTRFVYIWNAYTFLPVTVGVVYADVVIVNLMTCAHIDEGIKSISEWWGTLEVYFYPVKMTWISV